MKILELIICAFLFIQTSKAQHEYVKFNFQDALINNRFIKNIEAGGTLNSKAEYNALQCQFQLLNLVSGIENGEIWALTVFDAWGKIPAGILSGNTYEFGHYDQCLETKMEMASAIQGTFEGQYCLVPITVVPPEEYQEIADEIPPINLGICVPAVCPISTVQTFLNGALASYNFSILPQGLDNTCTQSDADPLTDIQIAGITVFSIIVALMVISTVYDVITIQFLNKKSNAILALFSIYTNGQQLFSLERSSSPDVIHCLNGIRTFSIIWFIFRQTHEYLITYPTINPIQFFPGLGPYGMLIVNAGLSIDTFLVLSGLLVTSSVLRELDASNWLNVPLLYLNRIIRLVPVLGAVILFIVSILALTGDGPLWKLTTNSTAQPCEENWWSTLLFIQNYYAAAPSEMCGTVTWYLAIDMQLFILSPILLIALWKWRSKVVWIIPTLVFLQMGCVFAIFYRHKYTLGFIRQMTAPPRQYDIYHTTHTRYAAWAIGIGLGYLIHNFKGKRINLSIYTILGGWIVSFGLIAAAVFGSFDMQEPENEEKLINAAMYETFHRPIWCLAIAWIIFACHRGFGGPINTFLSLSIWQPFAKLSYSLFLIHWQFMVMVYGTQRLPIYLKNTHIMHWFWGDLGFSFAGAIALTLAFEMPFVTLGRLVFQKKALNNKSMQSVANLVETSERTHDVTVGDGKVD